VKNDEQIYHVHLYFYHRNYIIFKHITLLGISGFFSDVYPYVNRFTIVNQQGKQLEIPQYFGMTQGKIVFGMT